MIPPGVLLAELHLVLPLIAHLLVPVCLHACVSGCLCVCLVSSRLSVCVSVGEILAQ